MIYIFRILTDSITLDILKMVFGSKRPLLEGKAVRSYGIISIKDDSFINIVLRVILNIYIL